MEDIKSNTRDFLGKDDYQVGDISKEVDVRVKYEVAKLRDKDEYELGDFVLAMDELSKKYTEELTGKPYEPGDLSTHLDTNIKSSVAAFCGKDEYEVGDLTREISKRIEFRVGEFTGKDGYEVRVLCGWIVQRIDAATAGKTLTTTPYVAYAIFCFILTHNHPLLSSRSSLGI